MPLIEWKPFMSVGNLQIDAQHKKLINTINTLYLMVLDKTDQGQLANILHELKSYTVTHFATEETIFEAMHYPEKSTHIAEHKDFIKQLDKFQEKNQQNPTHLGLEIHKFLEDWLVDHLIKIDQQYSTHFQD